MNAPAINPQLLRLSALIDLERRARAARGAERTYLIVNDTALVVSYQQSALWRRGQLAAVSGVATVEASGPYARFLRSVLPAAAKMAAAKIAAAKVAAGDPESPFVVDAATLGVPPEEWSAWFPPEALFLPLPDPRGGPPDGLLLGRQDPFHPAELQLLEAVAGTYGLALAASELPRRRARRLPLRRLWQAGVVVLVVAVSFAPVRSSVLAPAEIVSAAPFPIRAPFEGVVDTIHVTPNAQVNKGDRLISFETTERRAKAEVSDKALEIARAEYAEASQLAFNDPQAKGKLPILRAKIDQAQLEADYNQTMLNRAEVVAPADGVAVFDDAHQWIGRPVALGERIMILAAPVSNALDIAVPVADVVTFERDAEVLFFPNIAPDRPARGALTSVAYAAAVNPEGVLGYTARAHLDADGLRLGLKGTAKIYGEPRPFILWVLRRPMAVVREWLSL
jgi:hypothetical protein